MYIYIYISVLSGDWDLYNANKGILARETLAFNKGTGNAASSCSAAAETHDAAMSLPNVPGSATTTDSAAAEPLVDVTIFSCANRELGGSIRHELMQFDQDCILYLNCERAFPKDPETQLWKVLGIATKCCGLNGLVQLHLAKLRNWQPMLEIARAHIHRCAERHGRDRAVAIVCSCRQGRHRSVAMGEMLRVAIDRPHIGTAMCMHVALWQSERGPCGCFTESGCQQLTQSHGQNNHRLADEWEQSREEAHALTVHSWDYE
jgi:hypothetical protein